MRQPAADAQKKNKTVRKRAVCWVCLVVPDMRLDGRTRGVCCVWRKSRSEPSIFRTSCVARLRCCAGGGFFCRSCPTGAFLKRRGRPAANLLSVSPDRRGTFSLLAQSKSTQKERAPGYVALRVHCATQRLTAGSRTRTKKILNLFCTQTFVSSLDRKWPPLLVGSNGKESPRHAS